MQKHGKKIERLHGKVSLVRNKTFHWNEYTSGFDEKMNLQAIFCCEESKQAGGEEIN